MSVPDFAQVKAALSEAMAREGRARGDWMADLAQRDAALHAEVTSLLEHEADESVITGVLGNLESQLADAMQVSAPKHIGPYQILGVLGRGGMGVVYRARQTEPLERDVAIKVLRNASFDAIGAARFETEARALARLDHPHIAAVYDAGIDGNRPYLVLQLVEGLPLEQACEGQSLTERLAVFLDVCDAIGHAHQRGVVHRDIKPSNIIVGQQNGQPWAMVIDFGIARDEARQDDTLTQQGQVVGTPAYMSPEQAGAFGGVVDTRTDVYALGIVLYELVTGRRLFESDVPSLDEIRKRVTESTVPKPSTVAGHRGPITARELRGDLDTIVAMALRPEPDRRYGSVQALADDVRSHLQGRPVAARGDSASYLAGRFVRRHRAAVGLAAVVAVGVVAAATVGVVQDLRVRAQRDRAVAAEQSAITEAKASEQVSEFLVGMFEQANPSQSGGKTITARQLLDDGTTRIDEELADQPLVQAVLLRALASSYHGLGEYELAEQLAERSLAQQTAHVPPDSPQLLDVLGLISTINHDRGDLESAIAVSRRALGIARKADLPDEVSHHANLLAGSLDPSGRHVEAEALYREALEIYRRENGDDDPEVPWLMNTWAQSRYRLGYPREATETWKRAEELAAATLGADHVERAYILNNLAAAYAFVGEYAKAEATFAEALAIFEAVFGPDHAATGRGLCNLAKPINHQGRHAEALTLATRGHDVLRAALGPHKLTATAHLTLATIHMDMGAFTAADAELKGAEDMAAAAESAAFAPIRIGRTRARWLEETGDLPAAAALLNTLIDEAQRTQIASHPALATDRLRLAAVRMAQGNCTAATSLIEQALPVFTARLPADHPSIVEATQIERDCAP